MELETRRQSAVLAFAHPSTNVGPSYLPQIPRNSVDCIKNATVIELESISSVAEGGNITIKYSVICGPGKEDDNY